MVDSDGYFAERAVPKRQDLTPTEVANLRWLSHGLTDPMIADARGVSRETVKRQLTMTRYKLAAKTRAHAVAIALRAGIID